MLKKILVFSLLAISPFAKLKAQKIKIDAGGSHSLILFNDTVRSFGYNHDGQLGQGNQTDLSLPKTITALNGITAISAGNMHSLFLKNDGTVWACGSNKFGQLGNGSTSKTGQTTPIQVSGLTSITAVYAGIDYSLFLKNDGTVWTCGRNISGQLGLNFQPTPVQVIGLTGITAISGGMYHCLFLKNDGTVWAYGSNRYNQLGISNKNVNQFTPIKINNLKDVSAISAGLYHSLFLKNDGTVWACGDNDFDQLGNKSTYADTSILQVIGLTGITAISTEGYQSFFLKNDSTVWACGDNSYGQLGDNSYRSRPIAVQVSGLTSVTAISVGLGHILFLKNDGSIWACGNNYSGQLGIGEKENKYGYPKPLEPVFEAPVPPKAIMNVPSNSVCEGSNVNITSTITGSNPDEYKTIDKSINLNNPIAIDKNNHSVFVLNNNNSVTKYDFNGNVVSSYPNLSLTNIWAFTVDEDDNLFINNGAVDGFGQAFIYKCDSTGTTIDSIPNAYMGATNLVTDLLYYNYPGYLENLFLSDTLSGAAAIQVMNMNDNNGLTNSIAFNLYNNRITSLGMDNFYPEKRLLMADPINNVLQAQPMFNYSATPTLLIDSALTAGMALDFISADTTFNMITVSSRTKGILGIVYSSHSPDGSVLSYIDTTLTAKVNAIAPVGLVLVQKGNSFQFWIADNGQNKLLRVDLFSYKITPTLPAGLRFNSITGVIEGTPTTVTASQTYTLTIYSLLGASSSTFTLGVTPASGVSNTSGTSTSEANQTDGKEITYTDPQNCTQLAVITDYAGGTSPGQTRLTQTVDTAGAVTVGNKNFVRRVTSIKAEQTENLNAQVKFFYTYQDIEAFNWIFPSDKLNNDTSAITNPGRTMAVAMLHLHETFDTTSSVWRNVPTFYQSYFATWKPKQQVWELNVPVIKLSEFYIGPPSVATGFNCKDSTIDTQTANNYYVWNNDTLFTSGTYIDTLINHTGCDSIITLNLTINTSGISEAALASGIKVYPNPSNGIFNINYSSTLSSPIQVKVFNIIGIEVLSKTIISNDFIDLSSYQNGIYYLRIGNVGSIKTWCIVKQN